MNYSDMIILRQLQRKDAELMLEWMHDAEIQKCFRKNMLGMTLKDAQNFCDTAILPEQIENGQSLHYAIVDEKDEYLGTISLKDLDLVNMTAEYAISTRRIAHGKGIAKKATQLVLEKAFNELQLHMVYLNVLESNKTAIRFYEKIGFRFEGAFRDHVLIDGVYTSLLWYSMLKQEYVDNNQ